MIRKLFTRSRNEKPTDPLPASPKPPKPSPFESIYSRILGKKTNGNPEKTEEKSSQPKSQNQPKGTKERIKESNCLVMKADKGHEIRQVSAALNQSKGFRAKMKNDPVDSGDEPKSKRTNSKECLKESFGYFSKGTGTKKEQNNLKNLIKSQSKLLQNFSERNPRIKTENEQMETKTKGFFEPKGEREAKNKEEWHCPSPKKTGIFGFFQRKEDKNQSKKEPIPVSNAKKTETSKGKGENTSKGLVRTQPKLGKTIEFKSFLTEMSSGKNENKSKNALGVAKSKNSNERKIKTVVQTGLKGKSKQESSSGRQTKDNRVFLKNGLKSTRNPRKETQTVFKGNTSTNTFELSSLGSSEFFQEERKSTSKERPCLTESLQGFNEAPLMEQNHKMSVLSRKKEKTLTSGSLISSKGENENKKKEESQPNSEERRKTQESKEIDKKNSMNLPNTSCFSFEATRKVLPLKIEQFALVIPSSKAEKASFVSKLCPGVLLF